MDERNSNTGSRRTATTQTAPLSFKSAHDVTTSLQPDHVLDYAGVRCEQLRHVNQLLTNATTGVIELSREEHEVFQLLANEFAFDVSNLIELASQIDLRGAR